MVGRDAPQACGPLAPRRIGPRPPRGNAVAPGDAGRREPGARHGRSGGALRGPAAVRQHGGAERNQPRGLGLARFGRTRPGPQARLADVAPQPRFCGGRRDYAGAGNRLEYGGVHAGLQGGLAAGRVSRREPPDGRAPDPHRRTARHNPNVVVGPEVPGTAPVEPQL